jgi:hypothetical protein
MIDKGIELVYTEKEQEDEQGGKMSSAERVRRNDPCPCGSGKKYKKCCLQRDREAQAERVAWDRAAKQLRRALIEFAKGEAFVQDMAAALGLFWQDRYTLDAVQQMSVDESLRFFDWFVHDYGLEHVEEARFSGKRLIEAYRIEADDALSEVEAAVLEAWIESLPGSAFEVTALDAEEGTAVLEDLLLADRVLTVYDRSAASHGEIGQILLARPLPDRDQMYLSGATALLPAEEADGLREYMGEHQARYASEHEGASAAAFLRDRAYLLTHYALEWADREGRPAVAAEDPEAHAPGEKMVKRVVKWKQDQVQVR